jgi:hypothetical protein
MCVGLKYPPYIDGVNARAEQKCHWRRRRRRRKRKRRNENIHRII